MKLSYFTRFSMMLMACLAVASQSAQAKTSPPPAPEGFVELLQVNPRGGKVLRPEGLNLTRPGAAWHKRDNKWFNAHLVYEQIYKDYGCYTLKMHRPKPVENKTGGGNWSEHTIPVKPNRNYIVSVLVKTDFPRRQAEINVSLQLVDQYGHRQAPVRRLGLPAVTKGPDGWQRCTWTVTVPANPLVAGARAYIQTLVKPHAANHADKLMNFSIADFAFIQLPAKPLEPLARGEGVTFPGGPGDLSMKVVSASKKEGHLIVKTTGAKYDFNLKNDTIIASQRIAFPRVLAKWHSSLSLAGLRVDKQNDEVCVLTNDQLTIGIQCDSLMVISPQQKLSMTLTNLFGGDFNRYARGYLYSTDDFGGITVTPYIPAGTGLKVQSKLLTQGLAFAGLAPAKLDFTSPARQPVTWRAPRAYDELGSAKPGWQAQWTTLPGELFGASVFPPRPFPWKRSFTAGFDLVWLHHDPAISGHKPVVDTRVMWNYIPMMWGHSYSAQYKPAIKRKLIQTIASAHQYGEKAVPYMSAYWTPTRDPEVYIGAVRKWKQKYGIDGVYSDGLPSADWMLAYKEMRMLRELFPSGNLIIHNSIPQSGLAIAQLKPFMQTYASMMFMNEGVTSDLGSRFQYTRYTSAQFRKSNTLGISKPNHWTDARGKKMKERAALVDLVYNGRDSRGRGYRRYIQAVQQLQKLWEQKGDQPHFYDRYYLPKAQAITGYRIGRTGMPIVKRHKNGHKVTIALKSLSAGGKIYYTTDGSKPSKNSQRYLGPVTVSPPAVIKARAFAQGLDPSAIAVINTSKQ